MTTLLAVAALTCLAGFLLHILTVSQTVWRCRPGPQEAAYGCRGPSGMPPISIVRPVRDIDPYDEVTLRSGFALQYPRFELLFCCAEFNDPAVPLIRKLIAEHPGVNARLLIGADQSTANPKLNNVIKGWQQASHDWIILADCNVLMPPDYVQRLLGAWTAGTGLVCSPPVGSVPQGFWAEVECAFLNTYQARWQYAADSMGFGFAQGKSMLWRRSILDDAGGIRALGVEIAEDAAATKIIRRHGLRVRLAGPPFAQPLGRRSWRQLWARQLRWARLRRVTFPACFAPEVLTSGLIPIGAGTIAANAAGIDAGAAAVALAFVWYGSEAALARLAGWHMTGLSCIAWLCRDVLIPVIWAAAWAGSSFNWRGNDMRASRAVENDLDPVVLPSKP